MPFSGFVPAGSRLDAEFEYGAFSDGVRDEFTPVVLLELLDSEPSLPCSPETEFDTGVLSDATRPGFTLSLPVRPSFVGLSSVVLPPV